MESDRLKEALKKALEMEEKGHCFYSDSSRKIENDITKKTFEFLANNELLHIKSIKDFYETLVKSGGFPKLNIDKVRDKRAEELSIFSKNIDELKEKIKPSDSDREACEFAIDFENAGYAYYENMLKEAKEESLKRLLEFLLEEEKKHCEAMMTLHSFIADSSNWYMYEEESFPQGG